MVINQYHSIGDIIFIEPLCRYFWFKHGEKPILPVHDHLMWIENYIHSATFVKKSEFKLDYESLAIDNYDYLPLLYANQILREYDKHDFHDFENVMLDKYRLSSRGFDHVKRFQLSDYFTLIVEMWRSLDIEFNIEKGDKLFKSLGLTKDTKYVVYNEHCQAGKITIPIINEHIKIVYIEQIEDYTIFDWWKVMLYAQENHHVSTSTFFVLQALYNKIQFFNQVFVYPRPNEDGLRGIKNLVPSYNLHRMS